PLTVGIDERDERDGCFADVRSQYREIIKSFFRIGVENLIAVKRFHPCFLTGFHKTSLPDFQKQDNRRMDLLDNRLLHPVSLTFFGWNVCCQNHRHYKCAHFVWRDREHFVGATWSLR